MKRRRFMGWFEVKIVGTLVLMAAGIFAISVVLVRDVLSVATSMARRRSQELMQELKGSAEFYRELVQTRKQLYAERSTRYAKRLQVPLTQKTKDLDGLEKTARDILHDDGDLAFLKVFAPAGQPLVEVQRRQAEKEQKWRVVSVSQAIAVGPHSKPFRLQLGFRVLRSLEQRYRRLGRLQTEAPHLRRMGQAMQPRYFPLFQKWFAISIVVVTLVGLLLARRTTRQVTRLSQATARLADGDMDVKVQVTSRDELGQLADDFNKMVRRLQRSRAQIQYLQKISAWQEIARRLAHEIKNPLTPIRLAMQQVHDTYCGTDEKFTKVLEDAHEIVREEVDALRHMVEEFSAFAKLPQVRPEPESIGVLMDEFLRSLAATPGADNVRWHKPDQDVDIVVDRILFKRVLYNLVLNALQAGVEGGKEVAVEIRARAHRRDDTVEIRVDDNGPGIDEELRERIFDPYFTTKDEGTGLGLAIVKKILLEHKGAIDVADSPLGGARFVITVPRKPAGATPTAEKKASQEETKS